MTEPFSLHSDPPSRHTWLTRYSDIWVQHMGGDPPAIWKFKFLSAVHKEYGQDAVAAALERYLRNLRPWERHFASFHRFAETFAAWHVEPVKSQEGGHLE